MKIRLDGVSKRFTQNWIFKNVNQSFNQGNSYAITGPNGSGKSTLLLIAAGWLLPTTGKLNFLKNHQTIPGDRIYKFIDFISPTLELIEDLTLSEFLKFHFRFNELQKGLTQTDFIHEIFMDNDSDKYIRHFSSGMKQRLKLALGFYSMNPILFLDEPTSNLDEKGKDWYFSFFNRIKAKKLIIMASNQSQEYNVCDFIIKINDFKVTCN